MDQLEVSIGQYDYVSWDGGVRWSRSLREVPARHMPVVHGDVDVAKMPPRPKRAYWDFVTLLPCSFGVALVHERKSKDKGIAGVFVTPDGGEHWTKRDLTAGIRGGVRLRGSWPVEEFASLVVPSRNSIAAAWGDPWMDDLFGGGPESHVICSRDGGESWVYRCLGQSSSFLATDFSGRLLALNDGYYLESHNCGATWKKSYFHVDWPDGYDNARVSLLRHVRFTAAGVGYALIVHWPGDWRHDSAPDVGLVITTDNGMRWRHIHVFEGPNIGDVNSRHILDLRIT